jgi:pilus assembly protein Flp/PilA
MLNHLRRFIRDESGGTAIEYALIASGVAVAIIPSVNKVGQKLVQVFSSIQNALP